MSGSDPISNIAPMLAQHGNAVHKASTPREAAEQFESMLVNMLLKEMHKASGGMFKGPTEAFSDFFDVEMAERIGASGGLGLADQLEQQFSRVLGEPESPTASLEHALASARPSGKHRFLEAFSRTNEASQPGNEGYQLPVKGRISSHFGKRVDPINGTERDHHGLDIAAPEGSPIQAMYSGTVSFSGDQGGYGNVVIIRHDDGLESRYAHCSTLDVRPGDRVEAGQIIARVGSTGRSTGPHLHFEVRSNGHSVDPEEWLEHHSKKIPQTGGPVIREDTQVGVSSS